MMGTHSDYKIIAIEKIRANPNQPRTRFTDIDELASSIKAKGLLEPIMVRPVDKGFEVIHGERRFQACKKAGLKTVPAIVRDVSEKEAYELALIENVQRANLTPIEEATAFERLQGAGHKQGAIAKMIGKDRSYVAQKLRLLKMPEPLQFYLQNNVLSENHCRQIMKLKNIYGEEVVTAFDKCPATSKNEEEVGYLLYMLRPEEWAPLAKGNALILEGWKVFSESVSKHNSKPPQWQTAAFWWASMSILLKLSVANLSRAIDCWQERYESALLWLIKGCKDSPPKQDAYKWEKAEWWGYWSDLKQSHSLHIMLSTERKLEIIEKIVSKGTYMLPSKFRNGSPMCDALDEDRKKHDPQLWNYDKAVIKTQKSMSDFINNYEKLKEQTGDMTGLENETQIYNDIK
jgi:ParB/RepB/Spo0J family partition protein